MANKLLLIEDVEDLGRSGEIISARPGYARNFLLPRGLAIIADKSALRMQLRLQEERKQKAASEKKEAEEQKSILEGITIQKVVKVDHEGHMYGSVSIVDIIHLLQEQANITVEKRAIQLKQALKEVGQHAIQIKLKEEIAATINLKIVTEEMLKEEMMAEKAPKEQQQIDNQ